MALGICLPSRARRFDSCHPLQAGLAQQLEQLSYTQKVEGANPSSGTKPGSYNGARAVLRLTCNEIIGVRLLGWAPINARWRSSNALACKAKVHWCKSSSCVQNMAPWWKWKTH